MAITTLPVDDTSLTVVPLFSEEVVVAVAREHPLAQRSTVALQDLRDEPWVLLPENYELRETTLEACEKAGFTPQVVLDGGEIDTLIRLVASGLGITLIPGLAVYGHSEIALLSVTDQEITRSLGLVWRGDWIASPAARALREFLVEHLCEDCPVILRGKEIRTNGNHNGNGNGNTNGKSVPAKGSVKRVA